MGKRPTSADVARRAGVSRTTVSFVLNERPGAQISTPTRERVLAAAAELGYHAHASASQLAGGSSQTIGLVLRQSPEQVAVDALLPATLRGLTASAGAAGFRVLLEAAPPGADGYAHLLRSGRVDGMVVSGPRGDDVALGTLAQEGYAIVLQGSLPDVPIPSVDVDNILGAQQGVEYLLSLGHRRIGCITNAPMAYIAASERFEGYRRALEGAGIECDLRRVIEGAFDPASGHAGMEELLDRAPEITAVFVASDVVALGAIGAIRASGRDVPTDTSVVGFDDVAVSAFYDPPLTTVRVPAYDLGFSTGRVLLDRIAGRPVPHRSLLATELIVRSSADRPRPRSRASRSVAGTPVPIHSEP